MEKSSPEVFHEYLGRHFRIRRGADNLPIAVGPETGFGTGREQLGKVMKDLGFRTGIEIGTRYGESAEIWCKAIPGLALTCIDPYIPGKSRTRWHQNKAYAQAKDNAKRLGFTLLKMQSLDAVGRFKDASVDFVYIDGNHLFDFVVQDIIRYAQKVRDGGLMLVHDYCHFKRGGTIKAIDAYTHCHRIDPWYVTHDPTPTAFWQRGIERA